MIAKQIYKDTTVEILLDKTWFTAFDEPATLQVKCDLTQPVTVGAKDITTGTIYTLKTITCNTWDFMTPAPISSSPTHKWYKIMYGIGAIPGTWVDTNVYMLYENKYKTFNVIDNNMNPVTGEYAIIVYSTDGKSAFAFSKISTLYIPNPYTYRFIVEHVSSIESSTYLDGHRIPVSKKSLILFNEERIKQYLTYDSFVAKHTYVAEVVFKFSREYWDSVKRRLVSYVDLPGGLYEVIEPDDYATAEYIIKSELRLHYVVKEVNVLSNNVVITCMGDVHAIVYVIILMAIVFGIVFMIKDTLAHLIDAYATSIEAVSTRDLMKKELEIKLKILEEILNKAQQICSNVPDYNECLKTILYNSYQITAPTTTESFLELQKKVKELQADVEKYKSTSILLAIVSIVVGLVAVIGLRKR